MLPLFSIPKMRRHLSGRQARRRVMKLKTEARLTSRRVRPRISITPTLIEDMSPRNYKPVRLDYRGRHEIPVQAIVEEGVFLSAMGELSFGMTKNYTDAIGLYPDSRPMKMRDMLTGFYSGNSVMQLIKEHLIRISDVYTLDVSSEKIEEIGDLDFDFDYDNLEFPFQKLDQVTAELYRIRPRDFKVYKRWKTFLTDEDFIDIYVFWDEEWDSYFIIDQENIKNQSLRGMVTRTHGWGNLEAYLATSEFIQEVMSKSILNRDAQIFYNIKLISRWHEETFSYFDPSKIMSRWLTTKGYYPISPKGGNVSSNWIMDLAIGEGDWWFETQAEVDAFYYHPELMNIITSMTFYPEPTPNLVKFLDGLVDKGYLAR